MSLTRTPSANHAERLGRIRPRIERLLEPLVHHQPGGPVAAQRTLVFTAVKIVEWLRLSAGWVVRSACGLGGLGKPPRLGT